MTTSPAAQLDDAAKRALLRRLLAQRQGTLPQAQAAPTRQVRSLEESPELAEYHRRAASLASVGALDIYSREPERVSDCTWVHQGRELTDWCSYNYIGSARHPSVIEAAATAAREVGTSASASRVGAGQRRLHRALEEALAGLVGTEAALVFVSGYATNSTVVGHLMGPRDLILHDSLIHASVQRGAALSGATVKAFPHGRWEAVERILASERHKYEKVLINIEGVYSMDGDLPDLPRFIELKERHGALLMVDEAHSLGVLGESGRGLGEHFGIDPARVDLWMGTLSKTLGACGGYIGASRAVVEYLRHTAPGFVYSVGLTPPDAAAALAAVQLLVAEPWRARQARERAALFLELAREAGLDTGHAQGSAVVPIILGATSEAIRVHHALVERGALALPIMAPVVPENQARLRFFVTALHTPEQIRHTVDALADIVHGRQA